MEALQALLIPVLDLQLLGLIALGTFAGIYVGAIPGLSVTMAVSILISFTFSWEVYPALALMIGIYMGGVYGGSRTAILLNIPGAPAAIATAKEMPMVAPITAITLGRCSSRVISAASASTAPEMAPMPCNTRPKVTPYTESAKADTTEPMANNANPASITGCRPIRSDSQPIGICRIAWVNP